LGLIGSSDVLHLFVSKVLGKHWPVRPTVMREIHARLATQIANLPGPLLVIGMAETATALGRGVAEEAPGAYKDVSAVVLAAEAAGLARRVARLEPLICIKG